MSLLFTIAMALIAPLFPCIALSNVIAWFCCLNSPQRTEQERKTKAIQSRAFLVLYGSFAGLLVTALIAGSLRS